MSGRRPSSKRKSQVEAQSHSDSPKKMKGESKCIDPQMGLEIRNAHREMLTRTVCTVYELFQSQQIEALTMMLDKEARLDTTGFCDYNPMRGMFHGRPEIREYLIQHKSAVELKAYKWEIKDIDEARGTVLVHVKAEGKFRSTDKPFTYHGHDLLQFRQGHLWRMKFWGNDMEFAKASKTPATEMAYQVAMAFFKKDTATLKKLCGQAQMKFHSNGMDPKTGTWNIDQWMDLMKRYDFQYTERRLIHGGKNHVMLEYRCSQWSDMQTGQSLMGHRPEFFRFYVHMVCEDNGRLEECQMHMTPQPSGFLFAKPNGGASKKGLTQHVQHAHMPHMAAMGHAPKAM